MRQCLPGSKSFGTVVADEALEQVLGVRWSVRDQGVERNSRGGGKRDLGVVGQVW